MIAVILFQINILAFALLINCLARKRNYDGDRDVSLVQPFPGKLARTPSGSGGATRSNDDFSVGIPPPNVPLADKSDDRTLADIESIQSEKVQIKKAKAASKPKTPTGSTPTRSPAKSLAGVAAVSPAVL